MDVEELKQKPIDKAVNAIKNGGVIVFPTDTVYGFLALSENKKAVEKIFKIKKRLKSKPLAVFVKDIKMAKELAEIDGEQEKVLKKYWPGKYTFILKRKKSVKLFGIDKSTIALRLPKYKPLNDLLKKINKPLVQTSVNISGQPALTKISDIINQFNKYDILVVDGGNLKKSKPSKVIDLTKKEIKVLRK
jgi:L-threonylcarbamoyladenylate synthase